jgi:flagellar biosynthetic protein FliR
MLFVRSLAFLTAAPLFSQGNVPNYVKIGLAALISFAITPVLHDYNAPKTDVMFFALVVQEILIGLLLGFVASIPIWTIGSVGRLIASSMGMSYGTSISPMFPESAPPLGQFYSHLSLLFFVVLRADHQALLALAHMADLLPPGRSIFETLYISNIALTDRVIFLTSQLWDVAVQLALPIVGAIFLSDLALVLISRAMPRMNVFSQSLALKIAVGLMAMVYTFPYFWPQVVHQVEETAQLMLFVFR